MSYDVLTEKWAPVIEHEDLPKVDERDKKAVLAQVLENTEKAFAEEQNLEEASLSGASFGGAMSGANTNSAVNATGRAGYDPIIISLVRRAVPQMMAFDLCGVQPMNAPTGLIFALRARYNNTNEGVSGDGNGLGIEAMYDEPFSNFSGTAFNTGSPNTHSAGGNTDADGNPFAVSRAKNDGVSTADSDPVTDLSLIHI